MTNRCAFATALCLVASARANADSVAGIGPGGALPPGAPLTAVGTFTSDAVFTTAGTVASGNAVTVTLKGLQHGWSGDLSATLSYLDSQGNTIQSVSLFSQIGQTSTQPEGSWAGFGAPGGTGDNYFFNSDFSGNIWSAAAQLGFADCIPGVQTDTANGGHYFASDPGGGQNELSYAFSGLNIAGGTWRLTIVDAFDHAAEGGAIPNVGSLVGWEIDLQTSSAAASDFVVTENPAIQTVNPGGSVTYAVSILPVNGFAGLANLSVSGLPAGASASFNPGTVSVSGAPANSTLTISTTTALIPGSYSVTISAQAGSLLHSATATIAVSTILSGALTFMPVTPCRVADTRGSNGPFGGPGIAGQSSRDFPISSGSCGIPSNAVAYSLNVTVIPDAELEFLTVWPSGEAQPYVSTLNSDGRIKANAAIIPAGSNGSISVYASDATQLILDVNGYFVAGNNLAFYPVPPCRAVDTRIGTGPLAGPYLAGGQTRALPLLSSNCNIPAAAQAYSLNLTVLPKNTLQYLSTWAAGQNQPYVSTLNSLTGAITANAAIVPAGGNGAISVFATDDTDLLVDIDGYFAAPGSGGLSLYTLVPCRAFDTRSSNGSQPFSGILTINVNASACGLSAAQAYVANVTVIPSNSLTYLTLWPNGQSQPLASTLNALDGAITSNMAIVSTTGGSISALASDSTDLTLDIFAFFAP